MLHLHYSWENSKAFLNEKLNIDKVREKERIKNEKKHGKWLVIVLVLENINFTQNKQLRELWSLEINVLSINISYFFVSGSFNSIFSTHFTIWTIFSNCFLAKVYYCNSYLHNKKEQKTSLYLLEVKVEAFPFKLVDKFVVVLEHFLPFKLPNQ